MKSIIEAEVRHLPLKAQVVDRSAYEQYIVAEFEPILEVSWHRHMGFSRILPHHIAFSRFSLSRISSFTPPA
jgi:hypothetical protein